MSNNKLIGKEIVNNYGRIIIIGDLHGVYDEAVDLLEECKATANDTVIYAGDLIDRGPDNGKCVDLAMQHECILGNHESRHLSYKHLEDQGKPLNIEHKKHHVFTRTQLRNEHYDYFKSLPHYIRLPQYNSVVVHAGVYPNKPLEEQDPHHLLHIQMINPNSNDGRTKWPSKCPSDWVFWANLYNGSETVIFGHTVFNKPYIKENAIGIDCGAVFGGELWAYTLPDKKLISVKSRKAYTSGKRNEHNRDIKTYPIYKDVYCYS